MRSEEDKVLKSPVNVSLGGQEYEIAPLVIKESREWRKKIVGLLVELRRDAEVKADDPGAFEAALKNVLINTPEAAADLFFAYAKGLDREAIEASATDDELSVALQEVMPMAFPLLKGLAGMAQRLL